MALFSKNQGRPQYILTAHGLGIGSRLVSECVPGQIQENGVVDASELDAAHHLYTVLSGACASIEVHFQADKCKRRESMMSFRSTFLFLIIAWAGLLKAQEIKYIDLSSASQRTELRHPPAPRSDCKNCLGAGSGGTGVLDGASDHRDPHALGIYLWRVTPMEINPTVPFEVEFKVLNTGTAPIELPVSLHLSDLQPSDESVAFSYFSLALVVRAVDETQKTEAAYIGFVQLYGSPDHAETMLVLRPGEWIRVGARVKFLTWPSEPVSARLRADFWLRKNTFRPHPGGHFSEARNLYPNNTPTPFVAVRLLPPVSDLPKH